MILSSLLAAKFEQRDLPKYVFGYIMGAYAMSALISTMILPFLVQVFGRSAIFYTGLIMMSILTIALGFVPLIENNATMVVAAIL